MRYFTGVMSSTLQLLQKIAESPEAIVTRHPIRNPAWDFDAKSGRFVTERSDLGLNPLDPWNRPIPNSSMTPLRDGEGEVYATQGTTTVEGEQVSLLIFND